MRVLVACEYSAIVRDAFRARGHDAWSCDILPTEGEPEFHYQGDIFEFIEMEPHWDLMIAHPECTFLSNASVKWLYRGGHSDNGQDPARWEEMRKAANFYNKICSIPIEKKCVENPVMHEHALSLVGGSATQYVQPWWFGSKKNKATGFRLFNLPLLIKTNIVGPMPRTVLKGTPEYRSWNECWYMSPGPERSKKRAKTNQAVANALADQWGGNV